MCSSYFPIAGYNLIQLVKSACIINLTVHFCLTGILCLEGADNRAGDARAGGSLRYVLGQENLVMAASVSPRPASQARTVSEQFEYRYRDELSSWVCVQRQNMWDKGILVFSN